MIKVHHLNNSKSQRILWVLEELGLKYKIVHYSRQPSFAAPDDLKNIHPLGKAPVTEIDGLVMAESGAAVHYLVERYGNGAFSPSKESLSYGKYLELMHYAEGSLSPPMLDALFDKMLNIGNPQFTEFNQQRVLNHLRYVDGLLDGCDYLVDNTFSAADLQITFNLQGAQASGVLSGFANLSDFVARMEVRPAYVRSIEKGGVFDLNFGH